MTRGFGFSADSPIFMNLSVIVNIFSKRKACAGRFLLALAITQILAQPAVIKAQTKVKEQNPSLAIPAFSELLQRPVNQRPELRGVHPRLFFTAKDLPGFRERAKGADRELWQAVLKDIQTLKRNAPDPKDEDLYKSGLDNRKAGSISQYEFAFQIAQTSFAYAVEQDEKYFEAAKKWTLAACEMPIWGYTYNKPNVDLPPAHLLYAIAFSYDILFDRLTKTEKETIKNKLVKQARLMYDYFKYKPNKKYTYSQNHTWIPMAGLAIAAYALMDETEEAKDWAQLARAVFDRMILTFATDGYFYESFHYFGFAFRWTIRYFDAHLQATGENLYLPMKPKLAQMKYFAMHSVLPDGENVFDFADVGDGSLNRNGISKRETLYGEYDIIYRLANVYQDAAAQTVAEYIHKNTKLETHEPVWAFINHDANLKPAPLSEIPLQIYFKDNDTVFWRSSWDKNATAFAFRCAPPEGHHAAQLAPKISDWRENTGHAHPDANSFIIWANGKYLTGDTGYLGIKQTDDHNTVLVNGRGQEKDGVYEMFKEVPNERLNEIRIAEVWGNSDYFYVRGEAARGYYADLGLKKFDRHFLYVAPDYFVIWDEIKTEKPSEFSFLLNADREIKLSETAAATADLINQDAALRVVRVSPAAAKSEVVPQMIQARGLPGSVDKGDSEQRGFQLQNVSTEKKTDFEFLHFLKPYALADKNLLPKVSALADNSKGLKIEWSNGDNEFVFLSGKGAEMNSDALRVILRQNNRGEWTRLVWQNGKEISFKGKTVFQSGRPVSAILNVSNSGKLSGWLIAVESTEIKLAAPTKSKTVRLNGKTIKGAFDEKTRSLIINLPDGKSFIESE